MVKVEKIIDMLKYGEALKKVDRSGWKLAGAESERIESVAEHSYGSIFTSLVIAQRLKANDIPINVEKVIIMAILHDLPESITGDVARTQEFLDNPDKVEAKGLAERNAVETIFRPLGAYFKDLRNTWEEFNLGESLESQLVRGADIIDMLLHARSLETSGSSPKILHQFFKSSRSLVESVGIEIITEMFNALNFEHEQEAKTQNIDLE